MPGAAGPRATGTAVGAAAGACAAEIEAAADAVPAVAAASPATPAAAARPPAEAALGVLDAGGATLDGQPLAQGSVFLSHERGADNVAEAQVPDAPTSRGAALFMSARALPQRPAEIAAGVTARSQLTHQSREALAALHAATQDNRDRVATPGEKDKGVALDGHKKATPAVLMKLSMTTPGGEPVLRRVHGLIPERHIKVHPRTSSSSDEAKGQVAEPLAGQTRSVCKCAAPHLTGVELDSILLCPEICSADKHHPLESRPRLRATFGDGKGLKTDEAVLFPSMSRITRAGLPALKGILEYAGQNGAIYVGVPAKAADALNNSPEELARHYADAEATSSCQSVYTNRHWNWKSGVDFIRDMYTEDSPFADLEAHASVLAAVVDRLHSMQVPDSGYPDQTVTVVARTSPNTPLKSGSPDVQCGMGLLIFAEGMKLLEARHDDPLPAPAQVQPPSPALTDIQSAPTPPSPSPSTQQPPLRALSATLPVAQGAVTARVVHMSAIQLTGESGSSNPADFDDLGAKRVLLALRDAGVGS